LILDCLIVQGNPADTSLVTTMMDRQKQIYQRYPLKACFDGGFANKENLEIAKGARSIVVRKNVAFSHYSFCSGSPLQPARQGSR